ncbi:Rpn family recombination-promoting nuclease/putative transposase [Treponema pedis]|nr:Rpn family recombination-promoting nuclease/putative transposase [Treponema pedis]
MASTLETLAPPEKFTVRNNYAFKKVFGTEKNKDILIKFVSLVTGMQENTFADVRLENTELTTRFYDEKTGRLDIKIKLHSGEKINLEMQNIWFEYFTKRSIFYWTQLFLEDFSKGADYSELKKCIAINILNQPFHLANKIHSIYKILETEEHSELDGMLEIHFLDLTKIEKEQRSELEKWLLFIQTDEKEVRKMLAKENPLMQKAEDTMEEFYTVAEQRALYQAAWRYESDRVSMINESMRKGIAQGLLQGRSEGFSDGVRQNKLETASALKTMGLSIEQIMQATNLSKSEIEKL